MTREVMEFVSGLGLEGRCLDVGSYDVNGSVRGLFVRARSGYVGVDMRNGPNVDVVAVSDALPFRELVS